MTKSKQQEAAHKNRRAKARQKHLNDFKNGSWQISKRKSELNAKRRARRLGDNLALLSMAMHADRKYNVSLNDIAKLDLMSYDLLRIK